MVERKIHLRPLSLDDLDNLMTWINDPEVTKNLAKFNQEITRKQEREFLESMLVSEKDKVFLIENEKQEYIGQIAINNIYWPAKNGRLGLIIKKEHQNKGYAMLSIRNILEIAFNDLELNKIWAIFYTTNTKMKHITDNFFFKQEGLLRQEYFHNEKYHDMFRVAILRQDWIVRRSRFAIPGYE